MQGPTDKNGSLEEIIARLSVVNADDEDHAIIFSLLGTLDGAVKNFARYEFNSATQSLYLFFWADFCDWYLEMAKARMGDESLKLHVLAVQDLCLRQFLLLLHPFMPFISEELWHALGFGNCLLYTSRCV